MTESVWRARGIPRLVAGGLVSETADWMLLVALPLFVFSITGSAIVTSTVFVVQTVLTLVSAPLAGVLIDRIDPWALMGGTAALQAVALLPLLAVRSADDLWVVYVVVVVQSVLGSIIEPCRPTTAAGLVPTTQVAAANQLLGVGSSVARLAGAPLGGLVVGLGGVATLVCSAGALYFVATILLLRGPVARSHPAAEAASRPHPLADIVDGFRVVIRSGTLTRLMIVAAIMSLAQGLFTILFLLFVIRDLDGGDAEVGVLRGVQAVGALIAGLALLRLVSRVSPSRLAAASLLAFAGLSFATWNGPAVTTEFGVYVVLFILVGAPGLTVMTGLLTVVERSTPQAYRGRVTSLLFASFTAFQSVGMLIGGFVGSGPGLTVALNLQAGLYLVAGLLAFGLRPRDAPDPV